MLVKHITFLLLYVFVFFNTIPICAQDINGTAPKVSVTQKLGDLILFTLPITTLGTSFVIRDENGAWQFTKGFLFTTAITYSLKFSIHKSRPDRSDKYAFPSGHTSSVFYTAGYIHRRYGFKYSIPAYILAGYTAASRIDSNKHDFIDVLAGAAIGLGSNLLFTKAYQQKHMGLTFNNSNGNYMLGFKYKF